MTAQQTPADIATARAWRNCAHRADYASAAEHERDCPAHGIDAQPTAPHGCGLCDAPLRFCCRDAQGVAGWNCTECDWSHTSQDCCEAETALPRS